MFKNILTYLIRKIDLLYKSLYASDKNNLMKEILEDYSKKENKIFLIDFIEARWHKPLKELYDIINDYYNSKLSELIVEWDGEEISKLKYLQVILFEIKDTLNNNSITNE